MSSLKKALLLTTALTALKPCIVYADTVSSAIDLTSTTSISENKYYEGKSFSIYDPGSNPNITFTGGSIYHITSVVAEPVEAGRYKISNGVYNEPNIGEHVNEKYDGSALSFNLFDGNSTEIGNLNISGGVISDSDTGAIIIKKGNPNINVIIPSHGTDPEIAEKQVAIVSSGNININGGVFNVLHNFGESYIDFSPSSVNESQEFNLSGGTYNVGVNGGTGNSVLNLGSIGNPLNISSGTFNVYENGKVVFKGGVITFENSPSRPNILFKNEENADGNGKGEIVFTGANINLKSAMTWENGNISIVGTGEREIAITAPWSVSKFDYSGFLDLKSTVTVKQDFVMDSSSTLRGTGTIVLLEGANATFQTITDYKGSIIVDKKNSGAAGTLTFAGAANVDNIVLNESTMNVNSSISVNTLNINGSILNIKDDLTVSSLNLTSGQINFTQDKTITFNSTANIVNTATFTGKGTLQSQAPKEGQDKDFVNVNFVDADVPGETGFNGYDAGTGLAISVKSNKNSEVNFEMSNTSTFNVMFTEEGTTNFIKGTYEFQNIKTGSSETSGISSFNVLDEAKVYTQQLQAIYGSKINIDGFFDVKTADITYNDTIISGKGTLSVSGPFRYTGKFDNLNNITLDASSGNVTFDYDSNASESRVNKLTFIADSTHSGTFNIGQNAGGNKARFEVKELDFSQVESGSGSKVELFGNGILALNNPGNDVSGNIGKVVGTGTLELVGSTNISLTGSDLDDNQKTLRLQIGTGTATVSGNTELAGVQFTDEQGGTLSITPEGANLTLNDLQSNKGNTVTGKGKLSLTSTTAPSVLKGKTYVNEIDITNSDLTLGEESKVNTISSKSLTVDQNGKAELGTVRATTEVKLLENSVSIIDNLNTPKFTQNENSVSTIKEANTISDAIVNGVMNLYKGVITKLSGTKGTLNVKSDTTGVEITTNSQINTLNVEQDGKLKIGTSVTFEVNNVNLVGTVEDGTLKVVEKGVFGDATINSLNKLEANNARVDFNGTNTIKDFSHSNSDLNVNGTLTISNSYADDTDNNYSDITGSGTLILNAESTINSRIIDLNNLVANADVTLANDAKITNVTTRGDAVFKYNDYIENLTAEGNLTLEDVNIIGHLTTVSGKNATFNKNNIIDYADIAGTLTLASDAVLSINNNLVLSGSITNGIISLNGSANATLNGSVSNLVLGSGTVYVKDDITIDNLTTTLNPGGVLEVDEGKTATIRNQITGTGSLTVNNAGAIESGVNIGGSLDVNGGTLKVTGGSSVTNKIGYDFVMNGSLTSDNTDDNLEIGHEAFFNTGINAYSGIIKTANGTLNFNQNVENVNLISAKTGTINFNNDLANSNVKLEDAGVVNFKKNANIKTLDTAKNSTVNFTNGADIVDWTSDGRTNMDYQELRISNSATMKSNSVLAVSIDPMNQRYGHVKLGSAAMTIEDGASIDWSASYGMNNQEMTVNLVEGSNITGDFAFTNDNKRYSLTKVDCTEGRCYNFKTIATASDVVSQSGTSNGNDKNNEKVAAAILDGKIFEQDDPFYDVVVALDKLSQKGGKEYADALTAVAPDISGQVTQQAVALQAKIGSVVQNRMMNIGKGLGKSVNVGRSTFNGAKYYGQSGGQGWSSKYMRSQDYYRKNSYGSNKLDRKYSNDNYHYDRSKYQYRNNASNSYNNSGYFSNKKYDTKSYKSYKDYKQEQEYNRVRQIQEAERNSYFDDPIDRKYSRPQQKRYADQRDDREINYAQNEVKPVEQIPYGMHEPVSVNVGLWAEGLYNNTKYKKKTDFDGFEFDSTGVSMGIDAVFNDNLAFGLGYASTSGDLKTLGKKTDVDGDTYFLYTMLKPSNWYVSLVGSTTDNKYKETKTVAGYKIKADYDAKSYGGQVMFGYDGNVVKPSVGARFTKVKVDAYKDSVGQKVDSSSNSVSTALARVDFENVLSRNSDSMWLLDTGVGAEYDFKRNGEKTSVSLSNGSNYEVEGKKLEKFGANGSVGIRYQAAKGVVVSAEYNLDWRKDYTSHNVTANIRWNF
ncbi:MAG: autotransporter domain-containing protein [Alphaproteobacteria bacterium]|nr:autotransporter domain-containing protein [Alphaproteobacteria bacterium]